MWYSQSIVCLKPSKSVLEYFCISPFQGEGRFQSTYYISVILVYEIVFCSTFYLSLIYTGDVSVHMDNYDTFYFVQQFFRFALGPSLGIILILSLASRSAQLQLLKRMTVLDLKIKTQLGIEPSFCQLNLEFISCCAVIAVYNYGDYVYHGIFDFEHIASQMYKICCRHSVVYVSLYGFYTVYWARAYINRSEYIIDALRGVVAQELISKVIFVHHFGIDKNALRCARIHPGCFWLDAIHDHFNIELPISQITFWCNTHV